MLTRNLWHKHGLWTGELQSLLRQQQQQRLRSIATTRSCQQQQQQEDDQQRKLLTLETNPTTSIATLTFNNPPVNVLSLDFMQQIKTTLSNIDTQQCRGLILTAASDKIFSAGLDLNEIYQQDNEFLTKFWTTLQDLWQVLFTFPIPTAALVNGHAPAGGCLLAISCEYRVILPNMSIGLNETRAGVPVPKWVCDCYENVMPNRKIAEADLLAGKMYGSQEALKAGLVDALVNTKAEGMQKCAEYVDSFKKVNRYARTQTKLKFRENILHEAERNRQRDIEAFIENIQRPDMQEFLGKYLQNLKNKSKKTK